MSAFWFVFLYVIFLVGFVSVIFWYVLVRDPIDDDVFYDDARYGEMRYEKVTDIRYGLKHYVVRAAMMHNHHVDFKLNRRRFGKESTVVRCASVLTLEQRGNLGQYPRNNVLTNIFFDTLSKTRPLVDIDDLNRFMFFVTKNRPDLFTDVVEVAQWNFLKSKAGTDSREVYWPENSKDMPSFLKKNGWVLLGEWSEKNCPVPEGLSLTQQLSLKGKLMDRSTRVLVNTYLSQVNLVSILERNLRPDLWESFIFKGEPAPSYHNAVFENFVKKDQEINNQNFLVRFFDLLDRIPELDKNEKEDLVDSVRAACGENAYDGAVFAHRMVS